MLPLCRDEGIAVTPWSPLARGFVAGNRRKGDFGDTVRAKTDDYGQRLYYQDSDFKVVDRITEVATERGVPNVQIALAWLLQQPGVTSPIIGASTLQQLDEQASALKLKLTEEELKSLGEPYQPHPVLGHF